MNLRTLSLLFATAGLGFALSACVSGDDKADDTADGDADTDTDADSDTDADTDSDTDTDTGTVPDAFFCKWAFTSTGAPSDSTFCPECAYSFDVNYTEDGANSIVTDEATCGSAPFTDASTTYTYGYTEDYGGSGYPAILLDYYGTGYYWFGADAGTAPGELSYFYNVYDAYPYAGYYYTYLQSGQATVDQTSWVGTEYTEISFWPTPDY